MRLKKVISIFLSITLCLSFFLGVTPLIANADTPVSRITISGAQRLFYSADPTQVPAFTLTANVLPTGATIKTVTWSSQYSTIATVTSGGVVSLTGGYGTTAIVASATDGSGVKGNYYITVAAANPYDQFSNFESGTTNIFKSGAVQAVDGSQALIFNPVNQSGGRSAAFDLTNKATGGKIETRFDWYAGRPQLSKKDDPTKPYANACILSLVSSSGNYILSFCIQDNDVATTDFKYFTGGYPTGAPEGAFGEPLSNITQFDTWYTVDATLNYLDGTIDFTITKRDDPTVTQTVTGIPMSALYPPSADISGLFVYGYRTSTNNLTATEAIDNVGIKVLNPTLPTSAVTGLTVTGENKVEAGGQIMLYPHFTPLNSADKTINWTTSNGNATVATDLQNRVIVTGVSDGNVTITGTSNNNAAAVASIDITVGPINLPARQMEQLDRGLVVVSTAGGNFMSWRLLVTDPTGITFNIYKNGTLLTTTPLDAANTNFTDTAGTIDDTYTVTSIVDGVESDQSAAVTPWSNQYKSIPLQKPVGHMPDGTPYTNYTVGDGTAADLDGDGQYEIVFMWTPVNAQDNASAAATANVFIDAYKLDGTKLWGDGKYIDLGSNIRAGAHYTQLMSYDLDGDKKAEIVVKTADGTTDAQGNVIGDATKNWVDVNGFILDGPEYLTVFAGQTGKALSTTNYNPPRGDVADWGDTTGNRADRYLACIAYLDGVHPSVVMCRGYYTRTTLCAWDWNGSTLTQRWFFDSDVAGKQYMGQGNHNLSVADVDNDGKDEILYGAMAINDDGTPMYVTNLAHGDAMHVGKFDPTRPGLQVVSVHESPAPYGLEMHDALTGDIIWGVKSTADTGRGLTASIDPNYTGDESWSANSLGTISPLGTKLASSLASINMAIFWDGDTGRELFDGGSNPTVTKITPTSGIAPSIKYNSSTIMTFTGASTNGGTKNNPLLQADLFGDWREEVVLRANSDTELRIYTTTTPTVSTGPGAVPANGIPTLMQDPEYRDAIAWQNVAYNQPPYTDFYLGYNMTDVPRANIYTLDTVTFDSTGGSSVDPVTVVTGQPLTTTPSPLRSGYAFDGWLLPNDQFLTSTTAITNNITLYAHWSPVDMTILNSAIAAAQALTQADYTADSWAAMQTALDSALACSDDADQATVVSLTTALNQAINSLVKKPIVLQNTASGVSVTYTPGVVAEGSVLTVNQLTEGSTGFMLVENALKDTSTKFAAYDIGLVLNGVKQQPNGSLLITLPIPAGFDKSNLTIYYVADDGTKTEITGTVVGDTIQFVTNHFSQYYVLAEKNVANIASNNPPTGHSNALPYAIPLAAATLLGIYGTIIRKRIIRFYKGI